MSTYEYILKVAARSNIPINEGLSGFLLSFSVRFGDDETDKLTLLPPEAALDRQIYRKHSSHRFMEVHVISDFIR